MAQAKVVKSRRGNDLIQVTMGPKEAAKVVAVLDAFTDDDNISAVSEAIESAQGEAGNTKYAEVSTEVKLSEG